MRPRMLSRLRACFYSISVVVLLSGLVTGCQSLRTKHYTVPTQGPTTEMLVQAPRDIDMGLFANRRCRVPANGSDMKEALAKAQVVVLNPVVNSAPGFPLGVYKHRVKKLVIPADKNVVLSVSRSAYIHGRGFAYCQTTVAFTPKSSRRYMLLFRSDKQRCYFYLMDLTLSNYKLRAVAPNDLRNQKKHCI